MAHWQPVTISRRRLGGALLVGALGLAACADAKDAEAPALASWTAAATPTLVLGRELGQPDDVLLERVNGATRLDDGSVLIADLGDRPLKLFAADGSFRAAWARRGEGPGEFDYLANLWHCNDSLYAYDINGYRTSVLTTEGEYVRSFRIPVPEGQQTPYVSACTPDGHFIHLGWGMGRRLVAGVHRDSVQVWIAARLDAPPTVIDTVPGSERWGQTHEGRVVGSRPLPLGRQPHIAAGRSRFYLATGDDFSVRVYGLDGRALEPLRYPVPPQPVTDADKRSLVETSVLRLGESRRAEIERDYAEIVYPTTHAAVQGLHVDRDDHVWVRGHAPVDASTSPWTVFSPSGEAVAEVALPRRLTVLEIGSDYVLGSTIEPESGVPVVHLYSLQRR